MSSEICLSAEGHAFYERYDAAIVIPFSSEEEDHFSLASALPLISLLSLKDHFYSMHQALSHNPAVSEDDRGSLARAVRYLSAENEGHYATDLILFPPQETLITHAYGLSDLLERALPIPFRDGLCQGIVHLFCHGADRYAELHWYPHAYDALVSAAQVLTPEETNLLASLPPEAMPHDEHDLPRLLHAMEREIAGANIQYLTEAGRLVPRSLYARIDSNRRVPPQSPAASPLPASPILSQAAVKELRSCLAPYVMETLRDPHGRISLAAVEAWVEHHAPGMITHFNNWSLMYGEMRPDERAIVLAHLIHKGRTTPTDTDILRELSTTQQPPRDRDPHPRGKGKVKGRKEAPGHWRKYLDSGGRKR